MSGQQIFVSALKVLVPLAGVLFLQWSIGEVFLFFFLDIIFSGLAGLLRILSCQPSPIGIKMVIAVRFIFIYTAIVLALMIVMGHFFKGNGAGNMQADFEFYYLYILAAIHLIDYLVTFIFSGQFRVIESKTWEKRTYVQGVILFVILSCFLFFIGLFTNTKYSNYVLGSGIIFARETSAILLAKRWNK